jgi:hypothetical protein
MIDDQRYWNPEEKTTPDMPIFLGFSISPIADPYEKTNETSQRFSI